MMFQYLFSTLPIEKQLLCYIKNITPNNLFKHKNKFILLTNLYQCEERF